MPVLCTLGQHRPSVEDEVWNKGWYFTICTRCGANLVRTGSGKWHVPKGKQVVWRERTPRGQKPDAPAPPRRPKTG
jgi:predicted RNA-binding Zn-ribbon protein involved in translation (DUF1610 family)